MDSGRTHSEMKRPDVRSNHQGSKASPNGFHVDAVREEEELNEGLRKEKEQKQLEDSMRPEVELQTNFLLAILFVVIYECAIAQVAHLRKLGIAGECACRRI